MMEINPMPIGKERYNQNSGSDPLCQHQRNPTSEIIDSTGSNILGFTVRSLMQKEFCPQCNREFLVFKGPDDIETLIKLYREYKIKHEK